MLAKELVRGGVCDEYQALAVFRSNVSASTVNGENINCVIKAKLFVGNSFEVFISIQKG